MGLLKPVKEFIARLFTMSFRTKLYFALRVPTSITSWILLHILDNHFGLTPKQKLLAKKDLFWLLNHLKACSLRLSLSYFDELRTLLSHHCENGTNIDDLEYESCLQKGRWIVESLLLEALPTVIRILSTLEPDQLPAAEGLASQNKRLLRKYKLGEEERLANRRKKLVDLCEELFGSLSLPQKAYIRQLATILPDLTPMRLEHQMNLQNQFSELLKRQDNYVSLETTLKSWITNMEMTKSDAFRSESIRKRAANKQVTLSIFEMMTLTQRRHFLKELEAILSEISTYMDRKGISPTLTTGNSDRGTFHLPMTREFSS